MANYEIAQLNIAQMLALYDESQINDFVNLSNRIYNLAEQSKGFVWRLPSEQANPPESPLFDESILVNLSVWKDFESLYEFIYRSAHFESMQQREQWFTPVQKSNSVLWWVPTGNIPSSKEGRDKLLSLHLHGPTSEAFTFENPFPPPN